MNNLINNVRYGHINFTDVYGNQLMISQNKNGKIKFTLYHNEIIEGISRKDFESLALRITSESEKAFQMMEGIYEHIGSALISSEDPIRDGRNFMYIEQENEESYYLIISHDLANELNKSTQTNIEISGRTYEDLYTKLTQGNQKRFVTLKELS